MTTLNKTYRGVPYSVFIASWNNATLEGITPLFKDWLSQLEWTDGSRIPENVVNEIVALAIEGAPNLEKLAQNFIKKVYTVEIITAEGGSNNDQ